MLLPMILAQPQVGVTCTVCANFGGASLPRTSVLLVCLFCSTHPLRPGPLSGMLGRRLHRMLRSDIPAPLTAPDCLLCFHQLWIVNHLPCKHPPKLQQCHFLVAIPHKESKGEVHIYLRHCKQELKTPQSPASCHPRLLNTRHCMPKIVVIIYRVAVLEMEVEGLRVIKGGSLGLASLFPSSRMHSIVHRK